MTAITRDFIISLNYAWKYGICKPEDMPKARKEFGQLADEKLGIAVYCPSCKAYIENVDNFKGLCDKCLGLDKVAPRRTVEEGLKFYNIK